MVLRLLEVRRGRVVRVLIAATADIATVALYFGAILLVVCAVGGACEKWLFPRDNDEED